MYIPELKFSGLSEGDNCPTINEMGYKCNGELQRQEVEGGWRLECPVCGYQGEYVMYPDED